MNQERDRLRHNLITGDVIGIGYWFTNSTSEDSIADCYLWCTSDGTEPNNKEADGTGGTLDPGIVLSLVRKYGYT